MGKANKMDNKVFNKQHVVLLIKQRLRISLEICYKQIIGPNSGLKPKMIKIHIYFGRLEKLLWGEMNDDKKHATCIRTIW